MEVRAGYKQTELGFFPESWEVKKLCEISPAQSVGLVINPSTYVEVDGTVPMLVGSNIQPNRIEWESARRISAESNRKLPSSQLNTGDLVMVRVGEPGIVAVVPPELDGCNCASMMIVRQASSFDSKWLSYVMNSNMGLSQVKNVQYGTAQKQFNISDAVNFKYATPKIDEQEAIAEALSNTDALIESLEKLIEKKRQIKQGSMQELLTGKKRLPGFSGEWVTISLGQIANIYQPQTISAKQFTDNGYPVYGANGVVGFYHTTNHQSWQVTVTCRGSTCGTVNKTVDMCWITGNAMVINCDSNQKIEKSFLYYQLSNQNLNDCITGTGQPQIVRTPLANFFIKLPLDKIEQQHIASILMDLDLELSELESKLKKARQIKQGMMQELLTGRIRLV